METKANTTLIGAFTLVVLALAFGFIYWLARGHDSGNTGRISVVFSDPVTGLGTGGQVVFNGIKIGDVQKLRLDPQNPSKVIADLSVNRDTPIKTDTTASLGFQGLTGVGYVELSGGTTGAPSIWTQENPMLQAQRSGMQDLLAGARGILARADETLATLQAVMKNNAEPVGDIVKNVRSFTDALATSSDEVSELVHNASEASKALAQISGKLDGLVDRGEAIMGAVDPAQIRQAVDNVTSLTASVAARGEDIDQLVTRIGTIANDVGGFTARLGTFGDKADALMTNVAEAGQQVRDVAAAVDAEAVNRAVTRLDEVASAIDPQQVRAAVDSISGVAQALGARREDIDGVVTRLSAISSDVSGFTARLGTFGDKADALMTNVAEAGQQVRDVVAAVDAEAVNRAVTRLDEIAGAIDPQQVRAAVDSISGVAQTLGARREDIDGVVTRLSAISSDVSGFTARLGTFGDKADALMADVGAAGEQVRSVFAAVDPEKVRSTVDSIGSVADTLGARREDIDAVVTRLSAISSDISGFTARLGGLGDRADALMTNVSAAGERVRDVAAAVDPEAVNRAVVRIDEITAAVDPQQVRSAVDSISGVAQTVGAHREEIDQLVTKLTSISADVGTFTSRLPTMGARVDDLLAAVDSQKVGQSIDGINKFADALGRNSDEVDRIVQDAREVADRLNGLSQKADALLTKLNGMAGEGTDGLVAQARDTLTAVRQAAVTLDKQVTAIGGGASEFTNRGLRDLQSLINEGRQTVSRLNVVIGNLSRDPSQVIFGPDRVPEYRGAQRR
ncbi:MlaD family protein [Propylenella binzhouense]|nr:MlaD family protein [Propylenella binzhouense]